MNKITKYINRKDSRFVETVDEFPYNTKEERKECKRVLDEYRFSDPSAEYYLSQRCCKDWKD